METVRDPAFDHAGWLFVRGAAAETLGPQQQLAHDIYVELVEINTVTATGDTKQAAEAMAAGCAGGIAEGDIHVFLPAPRSNLQAAARQRRTQADPAGAIRRRAWPTARTGRSIPSS